MRPAHHDYPAFARRVSDIFYRTVACRHVELALNQVLPVTLASVAVIAVTFEENAACPSRSSQTAARIVGFLQRTALVFDHGRPFVERVHMSR